MANVEDAKKMNLLEEEIMEAVLTHRDDNIYLRELCESTHHPGGKPYPLYMLPEYFKAATLLQKEKLVKLCHDPKKMFNYVQRVRSGCMNCTKLGLTCQLSRKECKEQKLGPILPESMVVVSPPMPEQK